MQIGGAAIDTATRDAGRPGSQRAADLLECAVDDVVLDIERGVFHVARHARQHRRLGSLAAADDETLSAECDFTPVMPTFPFGAHVAVVEVDTETGHTRLTRLVALDDAGKILNPLLAEGQVHGGIAQGVAQALFEAVRYSDDGQPQTTNFADYLVISAAELPSFEVVHMETPTFANPLGAKGVGESGTIGAIPAVYNAVIDALSHLGVRHLETPLTPELLWSALDGTS